MASARCLIHPQVTAQTGPGFARHRTRDLVVSHGQARSIDGTEWYVTAVPVDVDQHCGAAAEMRTSAYGHAEFWVW